MAAVSVVIACKNNRAALLACLESLLAQRPDELIVVDASSDGSAALLTDRFPAVRLIRAAPGTLVPVLWKMGYDATTGETVAFTIAQCVPAAGWLARVRSLVEGTAAGVGGPIDGPAGNSSRDWALYFSRYSAFLPAGKMEPVAEIAGDNAAYRRAALERCADTMREGFWETLAHACLRFHGETLVWDPQMVVQLGPAGALREICRLRYRHGRHYAATRPENSPTRRLLRALTAPLLPAVLLARIIRRVRRHRPDWTPHLLRALPPLLAILIAWSLGEMAGYLSYWEAGRLGD